MRLHRLLLVLFTLMSWCSQVQADRPQLKVEWGSLGTEDGRFDDMSAIALDDSGNVFVLDRNLNRVQKFDPTGGFVKKWGAPGAANGDFSVPLDLAVDTSGNVYVADNGNDRIQKFDGNGTYLTQWPLVNPRGTAVHPNGNVYVFSEANDKINVYDAAGALQSQWGTSGNSPGELATINFMTIDFRGVVYLMDTHEKN